MDAYAKGPNFSAALAADGATLYITGTSRATGVYAIDTVSWTVRAHWLDGRKLAELWAAPDGAALYAVEQSASVLTVISPTSGAVLSVRLGGQMAFAIP